MTQTKESYKAWSEEKPNLPWEVTREVYADRVHEHMHPGELVEKMFGNRIAEIKKMLDVGGGNGVVGDPFFKQNGVDITILDIWWDYGEDRPKPDNLVLGNALDAVDHFGEDSFDYVQATEILEHMPKASGRQLIELLKRVTRKFLLFSTPYAYLEQPAIHGNPYQIHVCGWMPQEFEEMGLSLYFNASQMFGGWTHRQTNP